MGDTNSETLLKEGAEPETHKETFREMIYLLRDWAFMLFAVSNFLTSLGYPIPYTFVPVRSTPDLVTSSSIVVSMLHLLY